MYDRAQLRRDLIADESWETKPYVDTVGKVTIGVGHNLTANGLPEDMIWELMERDINDAVKALDAGERSQNWRALDEVRQRVLANMAFNMGPSVQAFKNMWAALDVHDYEEAADQMLDSRWASQVGRRAEKLSDMMRTGRDGA